MRHPNSVKKASDILYVCGGGELSKTRIQGLLDNYIGYDKELDIRQISYDGNTSGAWVNVDTNEYDEYEWLYIAAGDNENRKLISIAASS